MKIALLGGSFNPVHNGHLIAAGRVLEFADCNEVWFLPCYLHAFKKNRSFASEKERIEMLRLALKGRKGMELSLFEIKLGKKTSMKSRTLITVREIKKAYPGKEFLWVIGSDLVREIKKWGGFKQLIKSIQFIVVPIKGSESWRKEKWLKENNAIVLPKSASVEDISSRRIRKMVSQGKEITRLVPKTVAQFIKKKGLYLSEKNFTQKVFNLVSLIPKGRVSTYKEIAIALGNPSAQRAVGNSLHKNSFLRIIPCHRVVKSNGEIGGFSLGIKKKAKLLKEEGISTKEGKIKKFNKLIVKAEELKKLNSEK